MPPKTQPPDRPGGHGSHADAGERSSADAPIGSLSVRFRVHAVDDEPDENVTLPDLLHIWPAGVRGQEERFGIDFDPDAVRGVPIHLVVGGADTETWEIAKSPDDPVYVGGVNDESTTRIEKLKRLRDALDALGASTRLDVVEGAAHHGPAMAPAVIRWLAGDEAGFNPPGVAR